MRYGVLGTGMVGDAIGTKLVKLGHEVCVGSRTTSNPKALEWVERVGEGARCGTFAEAADFGERVVNCLPGIHVIEVLTSVPRTALAGKVLVDVANALDFSAGFPPSLAVVNTDSLGEQVQRALPDTFVVKTLNTVNAAIMVSPRRVPGQHHIFVAGDDDGAKSAVRDLLTEFGWPSADVVDLGGITAARATEMYLPLWLQLMGHVGSPDFNIRVVAASGD